MEVHVNAAMSVDGKLSSRRREQIPISGPHDFERVDRLRQKSDAILVGVGTVLADDPQLTIGELADSDTTDTLSRVVLDSNARVPPDAAVLDDAAPTYILVSDGAPQTRISSLEAAGATVLHGGTARIDIHKAVEELAAAGIERLLVEGGGETIFSFFEAGVVDTLTVFVGSVIIGGREAPTLADGDGYTDPTAFPQLTLDDVSRLDDGVLLEYVVDSG